MSVSQDKDRWSSTRNGYFIASLQVQGLTNAIRIAAQTGQPLGSNAIVMLRRLRDDLVECGSGHPIEVLPPVLKDLELTDYLAICEVLNMTYQAFLTDDEAAEQRDTFGFHTLK